MLVSQLFWRKMGLLSLTSCTSTNTVAVPVLRLPAGPLSICRNIQVNASFRADARKTEIDTAFISQLHHRLKNKKAKNPKYIITTHGSVLICYSKRSINLQRTEQKLKIACCKEDWNIVGSSKLHFQLLVNLDNMCNSVLLYSFTLSLPPLPSLVSLVPFSR